jgi:hypothetical protein
VPKATNQKPRGGQIMKPAVSQVKEWIENEFIGNSVAKVYFASASSCLDDDFYKVVGGGKTKYFYGETA